MPHLELSQINEKYDLQLYHDIIHNNILTNMHIIQTCN